MGENAIFIKDVAKCYKRYARPVDRLKEILLPGKNYAQEFWALRDINLEIPKGQTLGIIGKNGSGKSTLLQIIAGTLTPTTGEVRVNGRISALLELGSGFNPEFTGQQNVFFNGRLLGLSQEEIENKFDDIAAFADIGDFIEQPVKTYSSGMFVRLAFAVAVSVEPDILIVDEALAVGDIYFQQRCFERIRNLKHSGTTLLFVSHDPVSVYTLCEEAVLIDTGRVALKGKVKQVIDLYEAKLLKQSDTHPELLEIKTLPEALSSVDHKVEGLLDDNTVEVVVSYIQNNTPDIVASSPHDNIAEIVISSPEVKVQFVNLLNENGQKADFIISGQVVQLSIGVLFLQSFDDPHVGFKIRDRTGTIIFDNHTFNMRHYIGRVVKGDFLDIRFKFCVPLVEGEYTITIGVADSGFGEGQFKRSLAYIHNTAVLKVVRNKDAVNWGGVVNLSPSVVIYRQANV